MRDVSWANAPEHRVNHPIPQPADEVRQRVNSSARRRCPQQKRRQRADGGAGEHVGRVVESGRNPAKVQNRGKDQGQHPPKEPSA